MRRIVHFDSPAHRASAQSASSDSSPPIHELEDEVSEWILDLPEASLQEPRDVGGDAGPGEWRWPGFQNWRRSYGAFFFDLFFPRTWERRSSNRFRSIPNVLMLLRTMSSPSLLSILMTIGRGRPGRTITR